nr:reverse transcriptase domain-containing protein [Tanacetum cinerariifolium]
MPSHIKTYDGSEDPEDHLKIFQAVAKTERWAMPTWCHMFNSTLTGNARVRFDDLPAESIDRYDDVKKEFQENYLQQKKCIKDSLEIHNIKQRGGESTKDFVKRYKLESNDVKGALECMRIFGFIHGITNPELIKRLHDKIPKTVDEMMRVTTSFLGGKVAASNHERKKSFPPWKQQEGHTTDECMHLKKQIEEMVKAGKLSHLIKELKQNNRKEQPNVAKKGETFEKDKALAILMIGDEEHSTSAWMNFVVVSSPSPHNVIIGRPRVRKLQVVPSTARGMLKLPVERGVITLKSSKMVMLKCAMLSGPEGNLLVTKQTIKERINVAINLEYQEQTIMIGSTLTQEGRNKLCDLLRRNLDIFAWKPADMTGVPRHIAEHRLNVREGCSPVRQKKRGQAADRNHAIQEEVGKLHKREKSLPFFKTLKKCTKKSDFHWTTKAEEAFKQMKQLIAELSMLVAPMEKEELIVLSRPKVAGRLQKWNIELGEYAIHYRPRVSVKGHILADFIFERPEEDSPDTLMEVEEELPERWILFTDVSSCTDGFGAGLILTNSEGMEFTYALRFRFGLSREIISDNGKQFRDNPFKDWCEKLCIRRHFASVKHPQTNGLVERADLSLGEGIKARPDTRRKNWMQELSHVLWAYQTMIKSSNGDTPFSLTYETEAVILAEIGMPTLRIEEVDLVQDNEALEIDFDLLEERREQAAIREAKKDTVKLGPKWEGPYEVTKALGKGAYKLRDHDGKQLPRT